MLTQTHTTTEANNEKPLKNNKKKDLILSVNKKQVVKIRENKR